MSSCCAASGNSSTSSSCLARESGNTSEFVTSGTADRNFSGRKVAASGNSSTSLDRDLSGLAVCRPI
jgi:hypothetical protein